MANQPRKFLTKKMTDVIIYIVNHRLTQKAAAEKAGVNEATVWRWKQDSRFNDELEKATRNNFRVMGAVSMAVIESLAENGKDENIRLKAALEINERAFGKVTSKVEVNQTVTIEDVIAAMHKGGEDES